MFDPTTGSVDALTDTMAEYAVKSQAAFEARAWVDGMYQNHPHLRNVGISVDAEVLAPETFDEMLANRGMRSARPIDEMPPDLSDVFSRRPSSNNGLNRGAAAASDDVIDVVATPVRRGTTASRQLPTPLRVLRHPLTGGLIDFGAGIASGDSVPRAAAGAIGSTAGGMLGGHIGGQLGGAVGSAIPVVGTIAGAGVGAAIGGVVGGMLGGDLGRAAYDAMFPDAPQALRDGLNPEPNYLPFRGGQMAGVSYRIDVNYRYFGSSTGSTSITGVWGPIRTIAMRLTTSSGGTQGYQIYAIGSTSASNLEPREYHIAGGSGNGAHDSALLGSNITRSGGLPDTGGNPPALPTRPIAPGNPRLRHPGNSPYNDYYPSSSPQAQPRGDSPYHAPSARPAPGRTPVMDRPPVATLPALSDPKTGSPATPTPTPRIPPQNQITPDPELGWVPMIAPGVGVGLAPAPNAPPTRIRFPPLVSAPGLPLTQTNTDNDTPTGTRRTPIAIPATGLGTGTGTQTGITTTIPTTVLDCEALKECLGDCDCADTNKRLKRIEDALLQITTLKLQYNPCEGEAENIVIEQPRIIAIARGIEEADKLNDKRAHHACDVSSAIPESWARKVHHIPQLVVQFAEDVTPKKSSRWSFSIPHYKYDSTHEPDIPKYTRGNLMGTLILNDNSQFIANCKDEEEWQNLLRKILLLIDRDYLQGAYDKTTKRNGHEIESKKVKPVYGKFFGTGQKDVVPDWIITFPD
ncbi:hypothetical protein [Egbenema bharatensis]|uniref:hypothetical protein n=1 Tax=Egbenema bharatensis TaxID=3463334 RepID=UPI003A88711B